MIRPDGTARRPVRSVARSSAVALSWAPGGGRLAACAMSPEVPGSPLRLLVADIPGGRWRSFYETAQRRIDCDPPAWAPDGESLAVAAEPRGRAGSGRDIVLADTASGRSRVVSPTMADEGGLGWLVGGESLLATVSRPSGRSLVQVVPLRGPRRTVVRNAFGTAAASSNGRRLAALVISADRRVRPVVHTLDGRPVARIDLEGQRLSWSPDGRSLAIGAREGVFLWTGEGDRVRRLAPLQRPVVTSIAWSPDGRRLAVSWFREGRGD